MIDFDAYERRIWAGRAAAYERTFAKLCAHPVPELLDAARVGAGTRVLDVGCGSGTVAAAAFERGAVVSAVDAEPSMVELTAAAVPGAEVRLGGLPRLPFDNGGFDAVVANFVLNHVGDPAAAVGELRRLLRPGGRVALTIWPQPPSPLHRLWGEAVEAAGARRPADIPSVDPARDFDRTADGLGKLLSDGGFAEPNCRTIEWHHRTGPEEWWAGPAAGLATVGQVIVRQAPEMIAAIRRHFDRLSARYLGEDGMLSLPTAALLADATC